jgi:hypothetical protein
LTLIFHFDRVVVIVIFIDKEGRVRWARSVYIFPKAVGLEPNGFYTMLFFFFEDLRNKSLGIQTTEFI